MNLAWNCPHYYSEVSLWYHSVVGKAKMKNGPGHKKDPVDSWMALTESEAMVARSKTAHQMGVQRRDQTSFKKEASYYISEKCQVSFSIR